MIVEACVDSVASSIAAEESGALRVELNCALELDGLTPTLGLVQRVRAAVKIPIICMVRSRGGGFCYSQDDWLTMRNEISWLLESGVDGIAFGALGANGELDYERCHELCEIARRQSPNFQLVCHKAFDDARDWRSAMDQLVEIGFDRILTSGQAPAALDGMEELQKMVAHAKGAIEILPGGGVRSHNVAQILQETGCQQAHGSFRQSLGEFDREAESAFRAEVAATVAALKSN